MVWKMSPIGMSFELDGKQLERVSEWYGEVTRKYLEAHPEREDPDVKGAVYTGAIGGGLTYSFTNTSLGTVCKVTCEFSDEELDLTDYDSW